jgi:uncharacterized protein (TIGR02271 family)
MEPESNNNHDHGRWVFDSRTDDLRGWTVVDRSGKRYGTVTRMLVDPETEYIVEIEVEGGRRFPAHDLFVGDGTLTLEEMQAARKQEPVKEPVKLAAAPPIEPRPAAQPALPQPEQRAQLAPPRPVREPVVAEIKPATKSAAQRARDDRDDLLLQLLDEELSVDKRRVRAGGVHVETHLVAEPVSEEVRLRDEHVTIERKQVDRDLDAAEVARFFHDENIEISARSELPVIEKTARVTEEVVLKRRADDHDEQIRDTLRHMEAQVTPLPADATLARGGEKR